MTIKSQHNVKKKYEKTTEKCQSIVIGADIWRKDVKCYPTQCISGWISTDIGFYGGRHAKGAEKGVLNRGTAGHQRRTHCHPSDSLSNPIPWKTDLTL
ncbi:hypothetical protein Hanom_Chr16g01473971 [Helianthus anomalus]